MKTDTTKVLKLLAFYDKYYSDNFNDSHETGQRFLLQAYKISFDKNHHYGIINNTYRLAQCFMFEKKIDKSIQYLFICIRESEKYKDTGHYIKSLINLGVIYYIQKKFNIALTYFKKAISFKKNSEDQRRTLTYLSGLCEFKLNNFPEAITKLKLSLEIAKKENDNNRINECYIGLGQINSAKGNFKLAIEFFAKAKEYYISQTNEAAAMAIIYEELAQIAYKEKLFEESLNYANKAYLFSKKNPDANNRFEITELLHKLYFQKGDLKNAYKFLYENNTMKDTMYNSDISTQIAITLANYEFEKKETKFTAEIKEEAKQKNRAFTLAGIIGFAMIIVIALLGIVRKERKKSDDLILNILPKETVAELKKYGKAIPKRHESVTVLFCDVKQFTFISEKLSPEVLVNMLDMYISKFDEIVTRHGLEKIKTIGDAYMCAGGLHSGFDNHTISTLKAAVDIMAYVKNIEATAIAKFGQSFHFRIGIHTGPLVSGVVGFRKYAYDIWGDTVNIAARMEEKSEPGQINLSGVTYALVLNQIEATFRGMIDAKNKAPMEMYFLEKLIPANSM